MGPEVVVAATKMVHGASLIALSAAALGLPGIKAEAAQPVEKPKFTTQYGFYQEDNNRMQAHVYHTEFVVPVKDWMEFTFSFDQDTYVGASPYYSLAPGTSDVVSAASNIDPFSLGVTTVAHESAVPIVSDIIADIGSGALPPTTVIFEELFRRFIENPELDYNADPVQVLAAHPLETRNMPILGANFFWGPVTLGVTGGYSLESDFESVFGNANVSWELNNKLTTLSAGVSFSNNDIVREAVGPGGPHDHSTGELEDFEASNTYRTVKLGLAQVMGKNTLFHLNGTYTRQRGYLTNPYKLVNIRGEITAAEYNDAAFISGGVGSTWDAYTDLEVAGFELFREVRPDKRDIWTVSAGINQYFSQPDATMQVDYRFFFDNWGINSHTFDLAWYQSLPLGITVTPNLRYYSQSSADFFAPYFLAPRADGNYSSDYRLSGYGKISGGLIISKQFAKGFRLDLGFEYSTHQGSLKLGGGGIGDYADIDSYLLSAALDVDLSNIGRAIDHNKHHKKHSHHGGHPPAGIMFGHMLGQAGDFMVGYSYMYGDWSDGMQRGTSGVSDTQVVSGACAKGDCSFKADRMEMHMHMLNFMYAPTDWLNLMIMPQFSYMKMEMISLLSEDETTGGYHENQGLGDTLLTALFKLYEKDSHSIKLGVGVSAPTARIDVTFDGFIAEDNVLQSFGMQLGSGTWDLKPSLTYTGAKDKFFWGVQASGTKRLQSRNEFGYALGDEIKGSIWAGYQVNQWLSFSVRNAYKAQGKIKGTLNRVIPLDLGEEPQYTPLENTVNYGGQFWDIGLGMSLTVPDGEYAGHNFSVEWLQPVIHDFNGYQLERDGTLAVRWSYSF